MNLTIAATLARYPLPNNPTGAYGERTYAAPSNVVTNADQLSVRIDQKLGAKGQLFGRFNYGNLTGPTTNPDQTLLDPSFGVTYVDRQRNGVVNYTRTVSPRFLWSTSLSFHADDTFVCDTEPHRSGPQVQRRSVRGVQRCGGLGNVGVREFVSEAIEFCVDDAAARGEVGVRKHASIGIRHTLGSARTGNTILAVGPFIRPFSFEL